MSSRVRDIILVILMITAGAWIMLSPPRKHNAQAKLDLAQFVPATLPSWQSVTYDTADYQDQWQSINSILARTYTNSTLPGSVDFVLEYSSDVRRAFSFHFPEDCYRAGGNEVVFLKPLAIELADGKTLQAKSILIKGIPGQREAVDKLVVYWLVLDGKQIHDTWSVKIDQMMAGLMTKARQGFLVRVDVREGFTADEEEMRRAQDVIRAYISDLYGQLGGNERQLMFGAI